MSAHTTETPNQERTALDYLLFTLAGCVFAVVGFSFLLWLRF